MSLEESQGSSSADSQVTQSPDLSANEQLHSESVFQNTESVKTQNNSQIKNFQGNPDDKELYEEVLEKLDIKPREKKQDIQESPEKFKKELLTDKNTGKKQADGKLKNVLGQDFSKIEKLVKSGLINSAQGQNLKKQVLKKAFDKLVQTEKIKRNIDTLVPRTNSNFAQGNRARGLQEFSQNNPNFFSSGGRKEVLNYIKSGNVNLGRDELNQISNLVRTVEKSAIERYLQKMSHEKTLRASNQAAKQKLTANAQNSKGSKNLSRTFTREQIGNMNSTEFSKYESEIMSQLRKGQIK